MSETECTESYEECMRAHRKIAEEAVKANPNASNREIAKDLPVSPEAIRKAKNRAVAKALAEHDPSGIKAALRSNPARRNTEIARECGITEATVRQTRKRLDMPASKAMASHPTIAAASPQVITATARRETVQEEINRGKYSDELMDWIRTYQSWPKRLQRQARVVFFAIINGVSTNGAVATSAVDPFRPLDDKVATH
jgi:hypothetical protein